MVEDFIDGRTQEVDGCTLGSILGDLRRVEGAAKLRPFVIDVLENVGIECNFPEKSSAVGVKSFNMKIENVC